MRLFRNIYLRLVIGEVFMIYANLNYFSVSSIFGDLAVLERFLKFQEEWQPCEFWEYLPEAKTHWFAQSE